MNRRTQSGARPLFARDEKSRNAMWNFSALLRSLPGSYLVLENDLTIASATDGYLEMMQTTRDSIVGRNVLDVIDGSASMAADARHSFERVLRDKIPDAMTVGPHALRASDANDGGLAERRWSALNSPVLGEDGDVIYIVHRLEGRADATPRAARSGDHPSLHRAIERTLQGLTARAEERYEQLVAAIEGAEGAFALFDEEDRLVVCNGAYQSMFRDLPGTPVGLTYERLLDSFAWEIDFRDDAARVRFIEERRSERRRARISTFDVRTCDGRSLRVCDRPVADGGSVTTIWDLTEDQRLAEGLREARAAADAASEAKTEFVSSISHELRTPLNAILGFAQLLKRDKKEPLSERHGARVDQILKSGDHLLHLLDDLLDLARIEARGVSIAVEPFSLGEALDEVMMTLEPAAERYGVALGVEVLIFEPKLVRADRTRFLQILMNLGSNAIKYNRPGGCATFVVSQPTRELVRVSVCDTGLGIPANKKDQVFQPFRRAGQEAGLIEGTGIGLAISRRLARLMGGDLDFRSTEGQGSEFWVDIPLHKSERAED